MHIYICRYVKNRGTKIKCKLKKKVEWKYTPVFTVAYAGRGVISIFFFFVPPCNFPTFDNKQMFF